MKRYNVVLILCILLFFCSCGEKNEDIQGNNGTLSIFIEDYELQIPCDWMIKSVYSYQKADQPVLQVLIQSTRDHIAVRPVLPQQLQQHIAAEQPVGYLIERAGAGQRHVGLPPESRKEGIVLLPAQQQEGPARPLPGGVKDGGQIEFPVDDPGPAQHRAVDLGQRVRLNRAPLAGEHGVVDPVGQLSDVRAAGGQPVGQQGGGGEDYVGVVGQGALPQWGQLLPIPVAVVDKPVIVQVVQQVDLLWTGGPQQG